MIDKNISPVDWYVGSYLMRFIELNNDNNYDEEKRYLAWENTVIVKAKSLDEAYEKIEKIALPETKPYKGGEDAIPVQWVYEGITELLPIYEELEDGSEIMWREHNPTKLKNLKRYIKHKEDFQEI